MDYESTTTRKMRTTMDGECRTKTMSMDTVYQPKTPLPLYKHSLLCGIPHGTTASLYNNLQQTLQNPVNLSPFAPPQSYGETTTGPLPCIRGAPIDPGPMPYDPPNPIIA